MQSDQPYPASDYNRVQSDIIRKFTPAGCVFEVLNTGKKHNILVLCDASDGKRMSEVVTRNGNIDQLISQASRYRRVKTFLLNMLVEDDRITHDAIMGLKGYGFVVTVTKSPLSPAGWFFLVEITISAISFMR